MVVSCLKMEVMVAVLVHIPDLVVYALVLSNNQFAHHFESLDSYPTVSEFWYSVGFST
jgi:hypothetical protein